MSPELGTEDLMKTVAGMFVQELQVAVGAQPPHNLCSLRPEEMILRLRWLGVWGNLAELDEGTERKRSAFVGEKGPGEWMRTVRRRPNVPARVRVESRDADPWRVHAGEVVEDDPHRIESQVDRSNVRPVAGQVLAHEPAMTVLRGRLAAKQRGRHLELRG